MMPVIGAISQLQSTSRLGAVGMMSGGAQRSSSSVIPASSRVDTVALSQEARNASSRAAMGNAAFSQGTQADTTAGIAAYQRFGRGQMGQKGGGAGNCPHSGGGGGMSMSM